MNHKASDSLEPKSLQEPPAQEGSASRANVALIGAMGSGKSTVGWYLAQAVGFGFRDLDNEIEKKVGKTVDEIFAEQGEEAFRKIETATLQEIAAIKGHVLSLGGGAVVADENWDLVRSIATTIWLNPPPQEIARRLATDCSELRKRPLLAELADEEDKQLRQQLLAERLSALVGQRVSRYKEADLEIVDEFSTPEGTARKIRTLMVSCGQLPDDYGERRVLEKW